jgi:hypothetical protein
LFIQRDRPVAGSQKKPKEQSMNRFVMTTAAAAMLCAATLATTVAKAEYYAGPMQNDKQQCFTGSTGWREMGFGYWGDCPTPPQPSAESNARAQAPAHAVHRHHQATHEQP